MHIKSAEILFEKFFAKKRNWSNIKISFLKKSISQKVLKGKQNINVSQLIEW